MSINLWICTTGLPAAAAGPGSCAPANGRARASSTAPAHARPAGRRLHVLLPSGTDARTCAPTVCFTRRHARLPDYVLINRRLVPPVDHHAHRWRRIARRTVPRATVRAAPAGVRAPRPIRVAPATSGAPPRRLPPSVPTPRGPRAAADGAQSRPHAGVQRGTCAPGSATSGADARAVSRVVRPRGLLRAASARPAAATTAVPRRTSAVPLAAAGAPDGRTIPQRQSHGRRAVPRGSWHADGPAGLPPTAAPTLLCAADFAPRGQEGIASSLRQLVVVVLYVVADTIRQVRERRPWRCREHCPRIPSGLAAIPDGQCGDVAHGARRDVAPHQRRPRGTGASGRARHRLLRLLRHERLTHTRPALLWVFYLRDHDAPVSRKCWLER